MTGIMLAVVKENETNIVDQSLLFEEIKKHSDIQIKKVFLENLDKDTEVQSNGDLFF